MCELCELRERVEKAHQELSFRWQHFQVELLHGRLEEADKVEKRIQELTTQILSDLRRRATLEEAAQETDAATSLGDLLAGKLN